MSAILLEVTRHGWAITPADSARLVESVYTASLLITVPFIIAAIALIALRKSSAGFKSLIWRAAIIALPAIFAARALPASWVAWIVPEVLSAPLVSLGRLQISQITTIAGPDHSTLGRFDAVLVTLALGIYICGVLVVLAPAALSLVRASEMARRARPITDAAWNSLLEQLRMEVGIGRMVSLRATSRIAVPATLGSFSPVILLPESSAALTPLQRRAVLLHELGHIHSFDWAFGLIARVACAVYWFHPGVWWIARRLRAECEVACDDRVLSAGVRASDYAELLIAAADRARVNSVSGNLAVALSRGAGLRARLQKLLEPGRDLRAAPVASAVFAIALTLAVAFPIGTLHLAPTRNLLTQLMQDASWESRAYAVRGLAQRPDSVRVAQNAATFDPSPQVRALARAALSVSPAGRSSTDSTRPTR